MSQEYTEEKQVTLHRLSAGRRLLEALLIVVGLFAVWLLLALLSFDPADPSWSQTAWHEPIHNLAGLPGAWLADTLLFVFGMMAYPLPFVLLGGCGFAWRYHRQNRHYLDYFSVALRLIGALALIITSCGLAAMNADDIWYFASGGVIGSLLGTALAPWLNISESMLVLLVVWAAGLTLFTGWSWVTIAEKTGSVLFWLLTFASNRARGERYEPFSAGENEGSDASIVPSGVVPSGVAQAGMRQQNPLSNSEQQPVINRADSPQIAPSSPLNPPKTAGGFFWRRRLNNKFANPLSDGDKALFSGQGLAQHEPSLGLSDGSVHSAVGYQQDDEDDVLFSGRTVIDDVAEDSALSAPQAAHCLPVMENHRLAEDTNSQPVDQLNTEYTPDDWSVLTDETAAIAENMATETPANAQTAFTPVHLANVQFANTDISHQPPLTVLYDNALPEPEQEAGTAQISNNPLYSDNDQQIPHPGPEQVDAPPAVQPSAHLQSESPVESTTTMPRQASPFVAAKSDMAAQSRAEESLIHPLLMHNGDDRPLVKPDTPLPTLDLLTRPAQDIQPVDEFALQQMARLVEARLADFRIQAEVVNYLPGPVITRFELQLAPGVKAARISGLARDLARSLSAVAVRVVEVIPGKPYVGLELPNKKRQTVYLREVLDCRQFRDSNSPLSVVLGKDIAGEPVVADLAKMPHLLVAGTTGSGKSVGVNAMILSMLYKASPEEVRFIMIDPKMLELSVYEGIPHLLTEVITDMKDAANALRWSVAEMERRYKLMSALGVRNLAGYNEKIKLAAEMGRPIPDPYWKPGDSMDATHPVLEKLPLIVVIVDEFADLMMTAGKKVEELITRLAQKARAAGIHLVLATQRPSVDVITGLIKANIPTRIAFTVSSKIDSRTILDQGGAESLLGMGDMLYAPQGSNMPIRVHGAFVLDQEVHAVVQNWRARGRPHYIDEITAETESEAGAGAVDSGEALDPLFDQAVGFVVEKRKASISAVQRQFRIGYNRAARIIEQMELQGIVSEQGHNGNRDVLAPPPFE